MMLLKKQHETASHIAENVKICYCEVHSRKTTVILLLTIVQYVHINNYMKNLWCASFCKDKMSFSSLYFEALSLSNWKLIHKSLRCYRTPLLILIYVPQKEFVGSFVIPHLSFSNMWEFLNWRVETCPWKCMV